MVYEDPAPEPGVDSEGQHVVMVMNGRAWRTSMLRLDSRPVRECAYCEKEEPIWVKVDLSDPLYLCKDCAGAFCASQWPVSTPDGFCRQVEMSAVKITKASDESTGARFWRNKRDG